MGFGSSLNVLEEVRGKLFYGLHSEFYLIRLELIIWVKVVGVRGAALLRISLLMM